MPHPLSHVANLSLDQLIKKKDIVESIFLRHFGEKRRNPGADFHDEAFALAAVLSEDRDIHELKKHIVDLPKNWRLDRIPMSLSDSEISNSIIPGAPQTLDSKLKILMSSETWSVHMKNCGYPPELRGLSSYLPPMEVNTDGRIRANAGTPYFLAVLHFCILNYYMICKERIDEIVEKPELHPHLHDVFCVKVDFLIMNALVTTLTKLKSARYRHHGVNATWERIIRMAFEENLRLATECYTGLLSPPNQEVPNQTKSMKTSPELKYYSQAFQHLAALADDLIAQFDKSK